MGDVLLSHDLTIAVPSALQGLTAVFGMGTGVPPAQLPPISFSVARCISAPHMTCVRRLAPEQDFDNSNRVEPTERIFRVVPPPLAAGIGSDPDGILSGTKPHGLLVPVGYTRHRASTSGLSTRWSTWTLQRPFGLGALISSPASRLYAFSVYPIAT